MHTCKQKTNNSNNDRCWFSQILWNNFYSFDSSFVEVGVSTLKQLALTKGPHVPTLNMLVPYLDVTSNQDYLVKRIRGTHLGHVKLNNLKKIWKKKNNF